MPRPELVEIREYAAAGTVGNVLGDATDHDRPASYIRVLSVVGGTSLELEFANGATGAITVADGDEYYVEYVSITANTTCGPVVVGWSA